MSEIKVTQKVYDQILAHAQKELPIEACGYLAGKDGVVTKAFELTNIDQSNEHFSFDPKEQFEVMRNTRQEGLDLIANYHSHPETPARPSEEDIKLAYDPNILYFIASLADSKKDLKAFSIKNGQVNRIAILVVDD